jgi:hypothetical protein
MKVLLLCVLFATTPLSYAESVPEGPAVDSRAEKVEPRGEAGAFAEGRLLVAQVAAETAQLLPREKPAIGKGPTVRPRAARPARPARTHARAVIAAPARNYRPASVTSRFQSNAEQFANANGCAAPVTEMNFSVVGPETFETFTATCASKARMSIRCDANQCRSM